MAYCTATQIKAMLSETAYNRGLKDSDTADADAMFTQVAQLASDDVDAILEAGFTVPLSAPYPKVVERSARVFACDMICRRRGVADENNPYAEQAKEARDVLTEIAEGRRRLNVTTGSTSVGGSDVQDLDLVFDDNDDDNENEEP